MVVPEAGRDGARMQAVGRDGGAVEASRELVGEQHVGELRLGIDGHAPVAAPPAEVVEVDPAPAMDVGGDVHDAGGAAVREPAEQEMGQQEGRQVVDGEDGLDAVDGHGVAEIHHARVVHEHMQPGIRGEQRLGQAADRLLRREVRHEERDAVVAAPGPDLGDQRVATGAVTADEPERRPHAPKGVRGCPADPRAGAGHHADPALQVALSQAGRSVSATA